MEQVRRALRALVYAARWSRSQITLSYYRTLYSGLSVGKGVRTGRGVHLNVVRGATLHLGDGTYIDSYAYLVSEGQLSIGERTYVGVGAMIVAKDRVEIGKDALIAAYVTIRDQDHGSDIAAGPFNQQGLVASPISIGDNVWLGTKATILRGVSIGSNSIVGANSVVTRPVGEGVVAVGAPARAIKPAAQERTLG